MKTNSVFGLANWEMFEEIKGVIIRSRISKKDRQYNAKKNKDKKTNSDL
jgi:hypothetical protein